MPPFLLNIPDSLKSRVDQLAKTDQISMTQWILLAVAEKVGERQGDQSATVKDRKTKYTKTAKGNEFAFSTNSRGGVWVESATGSRWDIPAEHFAFARAIIDEHGKIELGASRDQPKKSSLGAFLLEQFKVNNASYIVPILRDEKYCTVEVGKDGRSYWVTRSV